MTLNNIFNKYGSDKGTDFDAAHGYGDVYEVHFEEIRNQQRLVLLEIGVAKGASLYAWSQYFTEKERVVIIGIDNEKAISIPPSLIGSSSFPEFGIITVEGDATKKEDVERVVQLGGNFDIVIDDGSHRLEDQKASFNLLWEHVRVGGWYVIEDVGHVDDGTDLLKFAEQKMRKDSYVYYSKFGHGEQTRILFFQKTEENGIYKI